MSLREVGDRDNNNNNEIFNFLICQLNYRELNNAVRRKSLVFNSSNVP